MKNPMMVFPIGCALLVLGTLAVKNGPLYAVAVGLSSVAFFVFILFASVKLSSTN